MDESVKVLDDVERHAETCPTCSRFRAEAWRVRTAVRFEVVPAVPDLVPSIMAAVRADVRAPATVRFTRRRRRPASAQRFVRATAVAAVAGLIVGFVVGAGGIFPRRAPSTEALAADIPRELVKASEQITSYRATFDVREMHWTGAVPRRTFVVSLAYRAPESFAVRVDDTTAYPSAAWPRNDLSLRTDGRAWRMEGPDPCPAPALPDCPRAAPISEVVTGRPPFDPRTPMPTDVILPMTTLAAMDRVQVLGPDRVGRRDAVAVQMTYQDARPLFDGMQFLGSWRPFYPQDRVVVWLDRTTWFPLRYSAFPAAGPSREHWATQHALPIEPPTAAVFTATVRSLSTNRPPPPSSFAVTTGPGARAEGFQDSPLSAASGPSRVAGLPPWRTGHLAATEARPYEQTLTAYADGLSWLTVTRVGRWPQHRLFGVGPFAERVVLPGGRGVAYYEPAGEDRPRLLALHTASAEVLLASDLPRARLIGAAGSLDLRGLPIPDMWRVHRWSGGTVEDGLTVTQALSRVSFPAWLPRTLPPGYRAVAAQVVTAPGSQGLTIPFRRPAAELDGVGILLYQATGQGLAPPTSADVQAVMVRGVTGRWNPGEHRLEWLEGSVYRSVTGPAFDLPALLAVAGSLGPPRGEGAP